MSAVVAVERLVPFTLEHFREWAEELELDNGEKWVLEPFQEQFVEDVFQGKPVCWLCIPQGNGKTTLVAGLALYHIRHKRNARAFVAAASREQATDACFAQMAAFVLNSDLEAEFTCQEGHRRVLCKEMNSRVQVRAADEKTGDGLIPTFVIIDELHRFQSLGLYRTWRGKLKKRNAQMIVISTAGEPGGEFETLRERMRQMAQEVEREECFARAIGEAFVLHDWAVPEDGDADDLDLVARANPLRTVTTETLREERESPDWNLEHWRRLTCNLPTRSEMAAITENEWFSAQTEEKIPPGEPIWVGLDVAWKWDTTAIVPIWWKSEKERIIGPARVLTPPRDGNSLDPAKIEAAFAEIHAKNPIHTVVMDDSRAEQLAHWISGDLGAEVIPRQQSLPMKVDEFERFMEALRMGWLKHSGDEDMTRHALNAVARILPKGDACFERPVSSRRNAKQQDLRVIDALSAASMAHATMVAMIGGGNYLPDVGAMMDELANEPEEEDWL